MTDCSLNDYKEAMTAALRVLTSDGRVLRKEASVYLKKLLSLARSRSMSPVLFFQLVELTAEEKDLVLTDDLMRNGILRALKITRKAFGEGRAEDGIPIAALNALQKTLPEAVNGNGNGCITADEISQRMETEGRILERIVLYIIGEAQRDEADIELQDVLSAIRCIAREKAVSRNTLIIRTGMDRSNLYSFLSPESQSRNCCTETLLELSAAMNEKLSVIFEKAYELKKKSSGPE